MNDKDKHLGAVEDGPDDPQPGLSTGQADGDSIRIPWPNDADDEEGVPA